MGKRFARNRPVRRGHLKQFSAAQINTGHNPNLFNMSKYYQREISLDPLPVTLGLLQRDGRIAWARASGDNAVPWSELQLKLTQMIRGEKRQTDLVVELFGGQLKKLFLFFNTQLEQAFFIQLEPFKRKVIRSRVYPNKRIAMSQFKTGSINWVAEQRFPPLRD